MTRRRDVIILIALFAILVVFTILGPGQSQEESFSSLPTTHSSQPGGALALLRWLQDMGYAAERLEYTAFELEADTEALFILNPSRPINRTDAQRVLEWVEQGGTLVLVDDQSQLFAASNQLLQSLDIDIERYEPADTDAEDYIEQAPVLQPVFTEPALNTLPARTSQVLAAEREDAAHLAGMEDGIVLSGLKQGRGYIYISSASFPFTNQGLQEAESAALVLNLLRRVSAGGHILFDEYHHGFVRPPTMRSVLLSTTWGWALLYSIAVLAAYLVVTGRRFGRPVPLREEVTLRSSAEYVESMADLFQRGGKRGFILQHYALMFKRRLARPYGINAMLDDEAFVSELARYREIDQAALRALLARLRREQVSEDELLRVVNETYSWNEK
jgi:hypothetical protein